MKEIPKKLINMSDLDLFSKLIKEAESKYEKDVINMSDLDLYDHVYNGDYHKDDFASKELKKRGIGKCECNGAKQIFGCAGKSCCYWERKS